MLIKIKLKWLIPISAGSVITNIIVNYIAEYRDYGSPNPTPMFKADGSEYLGVDSYE